MLLFVIILSLTKPALVFADSNTDNRLLDKADLLTDETEKELLKKIEKIQKTYRLDVVLVTTTTLEGKTPQAYADDFYDYGGYGFDKEYSGLLFLVSMEERDYYLSTSGKAIKIFTDSKIDAIGERSASYLSGGDYDGGFLSLVNDIDKTMAAYRLRWLKGEGIAAVVSLLVACLCVGLMSLRMNNARKADYAHSYAKDFRLLDKNDVFMYSNTSKVKKESSSNRGSGGSSSHRSSSGRSHGGGGGKF